MLGFSCVLPASAYSILLEQFHTSIRQNFAGELHDCLKRPEIKRCEKLWSLSRLGNNIFQIVYLIRPMYFIYRRHFGAFCQVTNNFHDTATTACRSSSYSIIHRHNIVTRPLVKFDFIKIQ